MRHLVKILPEYVENSIYSSQNCSLAQALRVTFPQSSKITVWGHAFQIDFPSGNIIFRLLSKCDVHTEDLECTLEDAIINNYDHNAKIIPLEFSFLEVFTKCE